MSRTERYRLFVAETRNDTMRTALDEAWSKASGTHVLIYKKGKCPPGFREMKDENLHLLPSADREWLNEVNALAAAEFLKKHEKEAERANLRFLSDFEKELEAERRKLAEMGAKDDEQHERV